MAHTAARPRLPISAYFRKRVLIMMALGFSSGLPLSLVGITLGYWLRDEGISLTAIGVVSGVATVYSLKFLWAPIMDRIGVPGLCRLGRRRGWMIVTQIFIAAGLCAMAGLGVGHGLALLAAAALVAAFASASQDIVIDAWRIENAVDANDLGLLTSAATFGYRAAVVATDALILIVAQALGWPLSYFIYAGLMGIGLAATLLASESAQADAVLARQEKQAPLWTLRGLSDAIIGPFTVFFRTHGPMAFLMLAAISLFQLPNFVMGPMANPLYHDIGLTKATVGAVRGSFGLVATFLGIAFGGFLSVRLGYMHSLIVGGFCQILGTALFALLPYAHTPAIFAMVMAADNFGIAVAGVALVAYMSSLTTLGYTATQYALLTSAYAWVGKISKIFSGAAVEGLTPHFGLMNAYALFFVGCGAIGVPALLLFTVLDHKTRRLRHA